MKNGIILFGDLTELDKKRIQIYKESRNLYNKYTSKELLDWKKVDLYEALDLDSYRYSEIPEKILQYVIMKKQHLYHPFINQRREEAFLIIKKAELIFSNKKYQHLYNSVSLDETIPENRRYKTIDEFLDVFSPVFKRNSIFSINKPVPQLNDSTPENFYKFWFDFKSNRIYEDPEDIIEQKNSNQKYMAEKKKDIYLKRKQNDYTRIQNLVKLAYKRDPRIKRAQPEEEDWSSDEVKSLARYDKLFGRSKTKLSQISEKLNSIYITKRTPAQVKEKLAELKK